MDGDEKSRKKSGWHLARVKRGFVSYVVDTRDYFIDFDKLEGGGYLKSIPETASLDNQPPGSINVYEGSYSWYVDDEGKVKSLFFFFPEKDKTGFQTAYP